VNDRVERIQKQLWPEVLSGHFSGGIEENLMEPLLLY
jgi:hypothetical protein